MPVSTAEETLRRDNHRLREEVDILHEQVKQLKQLLLPEDWQPPLELGLTAKETLVLSFIYKADAPIRASKILDMLCAMYSDGEVPEFNVVQVFVCKIRKKVAKFDIHIDTIRDRGYMIPPKSREILDQMNKK